MTDRDTAPAPLREQVARAMFEAGPSRRLFNSIPPVYYDFADAALAVVRADALPGHAADRLRAWLERLPGRDGAVQQGGVGVTELEIIARAIQDDRIWSGDYHHYPLDRYLDLADLALERLDEAGYVVMLRTDIDAIASAGGDR